MASLGMTLSFKENNLLHEKTPIEAMRENGFDIDQIEYGCIKRFRTHKKKKADKSGWYIFDREDGVEYGAFGCFREGTNFTYTSSHYNNLSKSEKVLIARKIEIRREEQKKALLADWDKVANKANALYHSHRENEEKSHDYLTQKGIDLYENAFIANGVIYIPLYDSSKKLWNFQLIYCEQTEFVKRYYKPFSDSVGKKRGCFHVIDGRDDTILICEGYSTGATLRKTTGKTVVCAMDAGNIGLAIEELRKADRFRDAKLLICCDNDHNKTSEIAAKKTKQPFIVAPYNEKSGYDFNDFYLDGGDVNKFIFPQNKRGMTFDDIANDERELDYIIDDIICYNSIGMIHGASGAGKSFLVLDMAYHIANGLDWCGKSVERQDVMYFAGEGIADLKYRVKALNQTHGKSLKNIYALPESCDFNTPNGLSIVEETFKEAYDVGLNPKIIFIDTLFRYLEGDENSSKDAKTMIDACDYIKNKFNCTVVLIHHTGIGEAAQARPRGSSSWRAAFDFEYNVSKKDDDIIFTCKKMKYGDASIDIVFDFNTVFIDGCFKKDGQQRTTKSLVYTDRKAIKPIDKKARKQEKSLTDNQDLIKDVWKGKSRICETGELYFTRKDFIDHMDDKTKAKSMLREDSKSRFIMTLFEANLIEKRYKFDEIRYYITDPVFSFSVHNA